MFKLVGFYTTNLHPERHMWYPRMTLIPMVVENIRLRSRYLMEAMLEVPNIPFIQL